MSLTLITPGAKISWKDLELVAVDWKHDECSTCFFDDKTSACETTRCTRIVWVTPEGYLSYLAERLTRD